MFATCLFCNGALGANEALEHFPVGRRIAYDAAKGRLWVVCRKCERWNLSPLETRWEAIEEAERLFRGTKLRVSTDNIALAQLREGTELVRIGKPIRTEFAAWRYGDQFGRRWRKYAAGSAIIASAPSVQFVGQMANFAESHFLHTSSNGMLAAAFAGMGFAAAGIGVRMTRNFRDRRSIANVRDDAGNLRRINRYFMDHSVIEAPTNEHGWKLFLSHQRELTDWEVRRKEVEPTRRQRWDDVTSTTLSDEVALRALATMLPHINRGGGSRRTVNAAVEAIVQVKSVAELLPRVRRTWFSRTFHDIRENAHILSALPASARLALEMSLHETDERRAMEGALHELEQRWKEADAIAKIADEMFLPAKLGEIMEKLRHTENKAGPSE